MSKKIVFLLAVLLLSSIFLITQQSTSYATAFSVTTTADSGAGSLRQAIIDANSDASASAASPHVINFNIAGGGIKTINVLSALPNVLRPTIIDGTSQPGSTCGDNINPRNILIWIRGPGSSPAISGLVFNGGNSTLQGVAVSRFRNAFVAFDSSVGYDKIRCTHLGTNAQGNASDLLVGATGNPAVTVGLDMVSPNSLVGGSLHGANKCDGDCNTIIGDSRNNNQQAILLRFGAVTNATLYGIGATTNTADGGRMQGNFIGLRQDGIPFPSGERTGRLIYVTSSSLAVPNPPAEPSILPAADYTIGGLLGNGNQDVQAANVISGARYRDGYDADGGYGGISGIKIHGNFIGTDPTGEFDTYVNPGDLPNNGLRYGNARDGISLESGRLASVVSNIISGNGNNGVNITQRGNDILVKNNIIGLSKSQTKSLPNGWFNAVQAAPNNNLGPATVSTAAFNGNGVAQGSGCSLQGRDCGNVTIENNVISSNARDGIFMSSGSGNNIVRNNYIGTNSSGTAFGNTGNGITIFNDSNSIYTNTIANNGGSGITIMRNTNITIGNTTYGVPLLLPIPSTAQNNRISQNSIFDNSGLPIDLTAYSGGWGSTGDSGFVFPNLYPRGVTPNDGVLSSTLPSNAGTFGNRDMDYPIFTKLHVKNFGGISNQGTLTISGFVGLNGGSSSMGMSTVEVFESDNTPSDQNGEIFLTDGQNIAHPEGSQYLGTCIADANGVFTDCVINLPASSPAITWQTARKIVGTATLCDTNPCSGSTTLGNTSEFGTDLAPTAFMGSVSGKVYSQITNIGYANQNISISGKDSLGNTFSASVATFSSPITAGDTFNIDINGSPVSCTAPGNFAIGEYYFCDIPASDPDGYVINQAGQPSASINGLVDPTWPGAVGQNPTSTSSTISNVVMADLDNSIHNNFGEVDLVPVNGRVYVETGSNISDDLQSVDPGLSNVAIGITCTGPVGVSNYSQGPVLTNPVGEYTFASVPALSSCTINETQPYGYNSAYSNGGTGSTSNSLNSISLVVPLNGSIENNFAETQVVSDMTSSVSCNAPDGLYISKTINCEALCVNIGTGIAINPICSISNAADLPGSPTVQCSPNPIPLELNPSDSISCKVTFTIANVNEINIQVSTGASNDVNGGTALTLGNNPSKLSLIPAYATVATDKKNNDLPSTGSNIDTAFFYSLTLTILGCIFVFGTKKRFSQGKFKYNA